MNAKEIQEIRFSKSMSGYKSDEVDDFIREIQIDSEATFHELHEAILKAAKYSDDQMTSFFICDDDWVVLKCISAS